MLQAHIEWVQIHLYPKANGISIAVWGSRLPLIEYISDASAGAHSDADGTLLTFSQRDEIRLRENGNALDLVSGRIMGSFYLLLPERRVLEQGSHIISSFQTLRPSGSSITGTPSPGMTHSVEGTREVLRVS